MAIKAMDDDSFFGGYNRVAMFPGHYLERMANRASHDWCEVEDDECVAGVCRTCCVPKWDHAADWPCGRAERENVSRRR